MAVIWPPVPNVCVGWCQLVTIILSSRHTKSLELQLCCCYTMGLPWQPHTQTDCPRSEIWPPKVQRNRLTHTTSRCPNFITIVWFFVEICQITIFQMAAYVTGPLLSLYYLLYAKFHWNRIIAAELRWLSIWRPSAILNFRNFNIWSCDYHWGSNLLFLRSASRCP